MMIRNGYWAVALWLFSWPVLADVQLLECKAETKFSISGGKEASDTRYIFSYDADSKKLVKLQEGDRPIAIYLDYTCRSDALQIYCERYSYGTYWTFQLTRKDASFTEDIGEYSGDTMAAPTSFMRGYCQKYDPPEDALQLE